MMFLTTLTHLLAHSVTLKIDLEAQAPQIRKEINKIDTSLTDGTAGRTEAVQTSCSPQ